MDSLLSDIDALLLYAGIHQQFFGYFRALSKRFPYAIYYRVVGEIIKVWRVLDCRQKPSRVADALQDQDLIASEQEAHSARVRASLADVEAGHVRKFTTATELLAALDTDDAANDAGRAGSMG